MSFLPDNYRAPKSSNNYLKLEDGDNKVRILSKAVFGWEDWKDNKPLRYRYENKPKSSVDPDKAIRHFWAMIVWNYALEEIQIWHVTQATIRAGIEALARDADWGSPANYDIKICKTGEGMKTEYAVTPSPHKPVTQQMIDAFHNLPCNLEALFDNQDPFAEYDEVTPALFEVTEKQEKKVSVKQVKALNEILAKNPAYKQKLFDSLAEQKIDRVEEIPESWFLDICQAAKEPVI